MKHFWSNSKEKLVAVEEGKANLEEVPKNGACKKFMQLIQFILVVEIALFFGWACYSFYQSKYVSPTDIKEDHLRINPVSALKNNVKLNQESPNDSDVITWQEKSSQNKAFDPPSSSEPWSAKTQNVEIPESSTERDSVLLNEDSVYHPQSSLPYVTTPAEIKTSTSEFVKESTETFEEKFRNLEAQKIQTSEESPIPSLLNVFRPKIIEEVDNLENLSISPSPDAATPLDHFEEKMKSLEAEKIENSEENAIQILLSVLHAQEAIEELKNLANLAQKSETGTETLLKSEETPGKMEEDGFSKKIEQEVEKMLNDSQKNEELPLTSFIQILHDIDRAEAKAKAIEKIAATEIVPSNEGNFKRYHFQFSMGPETGIQKSEDNQNSPVVSKQLPFLIRVFFNVSDGDLSSAENADSVLNSEESVLDAVSPFIDPGFYQQSKTEESPLDEETLKWWVSIPQFQGTKVGDLSNEESEADSSILGSIPENEITGEKSLFDLFFNQPDSQSAISESNELIKPPPENLNNFLTDLVSEILPSKKDPIDQMMNEEMNSVESKEEILKDMIPEEASANEKKLLKQMEDFMKALANVKIADEDHKSVGTQNESHLYQEESMTMREETVSEDDPEIREEELAWKDEENWFQSQPTWKEDSDGYLNDFFTNLEPQIEEYDEHSNFDSEEYMYED